MYLFTPFLHLKEAVLTALKSGRALMNPVPSKHVADAVLL